MLKPSETLINVATFTFTNTSLKMEKTTFIRHSKALVHTANAKQGNFRMASELKMNKFHGDGKKSYNCN